MSKRLLGLAFFGIVAAQAFAGEPLPPRDLDVAADDGTRLRATYYAAAAPGPAVLLLHMCNSDRSSWRPLGPQLSAAGIHALAFDYRGYGESGGERFAGATRERQRIVSEKWPGDVDAALAALTRQPGVDRIRIGAAGGSCGVNQAVHLASRRSEVRSLVLLAGPADRAGRQFLRRASWLPVFTAAAADDQYDADALRSMQWMADLSGNPRNRFAGFTDGRHGTEIFGPHPELIGQIVDWYVDTLVKNPADAGAKVALRTTPASEFWAAAEAPDGAGAAARAFREARRRDPNAYLFPEAALNLLVYERVQEGRPREAVELAALNAEAYPDSANVYDTLADAHLAAGQRDLALQAARQALAALSRDKGSPELKEAVRHSAEQKVKQLEAGSKP